jgi:uncharacterized protein (DUF2141 family)
MNLPCPSALAFTTLVLAAALAPLAATAADAAADAVQAQGVPEATEAAPAAPAAPAASAADPAGRCVSVDVHNVRPQQGQLFLAAYVSAETYNKRPLASTRVPAGDAITRVQLCGISGHEFAVTLYQDLDGDGKMAKNMLGLPTEPWGSTGKPGMFGPSWETGKVTLNGNPVIAQLSQ